MKMAVGSRLSALGWVGAVALLPLGAATQHEEISPSVRVHRIYPVLAAAEAAPAAPQQPRGDAPGEGGTARKLEDIPKLVVRGNASLDKPADRLLLDLGVVTQQETPSGALQENSRAMDQVVKAIRKVGLEAGEFQTGHFDLQPVYSQRPMRAEVPDWQPKIIAYRASNSVHVKTKKLDLAGQLIQAANEAGANQIGSIGFDLADPRVHRAEAIKTATANALTDARTLAEAAGVVLVRIVSIDLDQFGYQPVQNYFGGGPMMRTAAAEAPPPPIAPGDVPVTAGVTVVYEIRDNK